ncbi:hypothetical protein I302_108499 [Kwoniella bestiolae CBS 10118]|uniref:Inhibitor I9 domain-containing protein n=1 Tax=Kwoniella bestiolae CBS 10118 TaxID=1296100 RepID=A0A1B9FVJ7_9TREE|nr:hypothetical protein I302_07125 [Kwoniella bestiolae CBS 10118]OCF22784.1 hypothetical protein I302_07125 [Kwoniella bestiolae CBS 10118]
MQLSIKSLLFFIYLTLLTASAYQLSLDNINMAHKDVIVQFKKSSSSEERQKIIDDLKAKGATIVKDDNLNSKILPFITVSLSASDFSTLQADFGGDHDVVENVEADQVVTTQ